MRTRVGVIDRSVVILDALRFRPRSLPELVEATQLPRPTVHRLATALEAHGLLIKNGGRWSLGPRLHALGAFAGGGHTIREAARPALLQLRDFTGESSQLYVRRGSERLCIDAVESTEELRTIVPMGALLPLAMGSAGKVFLAWMPEHEVRAVHPRFHGAGGMMVEDVEGIARHLAAVRRQGWSESAEERESGVASVSAPIFDGHGSLTAVVSVSGPVMRTGRRPGKHYASAVVSAARRIEQALGVGEPA